MMKTKTIEGEINHDKRKIERIIQENAKGR